MDERHHETRATDPEVVRLPSRRTLPLALTATIVAFLAVVVWAPWGHDAGSPSSAAGTAPTATARYESITDNEWTIVALLTPGAGPSVEEPANQHVDLPAPAADGPFIVMQQGVLPVAAPIERPDKLAATCATSEPPRDQRVVHLPRGRVVYLGLTYPGIDESADVAARALGDPTIQLHRAEPLAVQLAGKEPGVRYLVPSSGPGGTILFTALPAARLPSVPYRFELRIPGIAGPRFLYACIDA